MNKQIIFSLPGNEIMARNLAGILNIELGAAEIKSFPDGESYLNIISDVKGKDVLLLCTLDQPDSKLLTLYFFSKTLKEFKVSKLILIAPYLAYMRQDMRFKKGEAITSSLFGQLVSSFVDSLITIDPHLHRWPNLEKIYSIPVKVLHAAPLISDWIKRNVPQAFVIGPDTESKQWVSQVAGEAGIPYVILQKERLSDKTVTIKLPELTKVKDFTPVIVDDIISSGSTMIAVTKLLQKEGLKPPVCIGVHGVFAGNSYFDLLASGVDKIITTNSIPHASNRISIFDLIAAACR